MRKKTIHEPTCPTLVFFRGELAFQSFTFEKEIMNVLTASIVWETFFPESNPTMEPLDYGAF